jgi:holo-[acyl-carrier protein] synthase
LHRVGIDLIDVADVGESIAAFGKRYLDRVFTPAERAECGGSVARLAERFAAKEATMKALGRGDEALAWTAIEVTDGGDGRPVLALTGQAAELAARRGLRHSAVSLTHQRDHAAAVVLMEADR